MFLAYVHIVKIRTLSLNLCKGTTCLIHKKIIARKTPIIFVHCPKKLNFAKKMRVFCSYNMVNEQKSR